MSTPTPPSRDQLAACPSTPGPWHFVRQGGKASKVYCIGTDLAGALLFTAADNPNGEADARLAASAPDMHRHLAEMREALQAVHDWRGLCDYNLVETFERIAQDFHRETGFLRPGKDDAMNHPEGWEGKRREAWAAWTAMKNAALDRQICTALSRDGGIGGGAMEPKEQR